MLNSQWMQSTQHLERLLKQSTLACVLHASDVWTMFMLNDCGVLIWRVKCVGANCLTNYGNPSKKGRLDARQVKFKKGRDRKSQQIRNVRCQAEEDLEDCETLVTKVWLAQRPFDIRYISKSESYNCETRVVLELSRFNLWMD